MHHLTVRLLRQTINTQNSRVFMASQHHHHPLPNSTSHVHQWQPPSYTRQFHTTTCTRRQWDPGYNGPHSKKPNTEPTKAKNPTPSDRSTNNPPPTPPKSRSGIKYHTPDPIIVDKKPMVVHASPAAAREAVLAHNATPTKSKRGDSQAESLLGVLNRIRKHKIYQLTRLFMVGSVLILMSNRITEAKMTPDEVFTEDDDWLDKIRKTMKKTFRVAFSTITRTWSPFGEVQLTEVIENDDDDADDGHVIGATGDLAGDEYCTINQPKGKVVVMLDDKGNINNSNQLPAAGRLINVWDAPLPSVNVDPTASTNTAV